MADKDLLVIIAEMLRKQDQHTEILKQQTGMLAETNTTLKQLVEISVHQFQLQQDFNERQLHFNENMLGKVDNIEKTMVKSINLEDRINRLENAVFKSNN